MTAIKKKLTLLICIALSLLMIFVLSSCGNDEADSTNAGNSNTNTDTGEDDNTSELPTGCVIEEADGFLFDTTGTISKIYKNVSNTTELIDLSRSITVTEGCTWRLYEDFLGEEEYRLKSMALTIGENKAYVVVYHPDGETFTRYELVLYRLDIKDYSFTSDNAPYENGTIEELSSVEAPTTNPQKTGYDFIGWAVDGEIASFPYQVSEDTVFEAEFAPIEYEIEYNLNDGVNNAENSLKYTIEQNVALLEPTRDFYNFAGWYESDNFEGNAITEIAEGSYGNKAFYAKWTPTTYNISYELDGGTNNAENPSTYNTEISVELKAPTKAGYTFAGWFADNALSVETTGISLGEGNEKTFYAKWTANENTLSFDANGGTGSMSNMTIATDASANLTNNTFTKDGYTFMGWSTDANGEIDYTDGVIYTMGTESAYTLYAVWQANINGVIFNANGGTGTMSSLEIATDSSANLINNTYVKPGYTFIGWSTTEDGEVEYVDGASYVMGTNSTYTLYAVWQANNNTLVFNANGGTGSMSNMTIATDSSANLTNNTFTKAGYTFIGWSTTEDGEVEYVDGASYVMGTNSSYTLYAVWQANNNTLVFNANGGTGSMSNMTIATDSSANLTNNTFTKAGYTFIGWATSKNGSVVYTNGASYVMGTNSSYTLYAVWQVNNNTLVFNANGGSGTMTNMTIATGASKTLTSNTFTRAGYTFIGWSTNASGGVEYETGDTYTMGTNSTYTLYAVWETIEYSITYDLIFDGVDNSLNTTLTYTVEDTITLKAPTKESFYFLGWYTEASFENKIDKIENRTGNITLYAKWTTNDTALTFTEAEGGYSVTGCVADIDVAIIPEIYNGSPVTTIGNDAFSGCTSLESITIPNSVTSIGYYAFYGCTSLTSVNYLGTIEQWCNITFDNDYANPLNNGANLYLNGALVTDLVIPNTVTEIKACAFSGCTSLTSVTLPNSETTIGDSVFYDCTSLESVTIPDSVTKIGYSVFENCTSLTSVNYLGTIEQWCNISFGYYANPLSNGAKLYLNGVLVTDLIIPNTVTQINANTFWGCTSLTSVTLPNSETTIGDSVFYDCTSLESVTIPDSVTSIGYDAFYNCTSLTSVNYLGTIEQWCNISFDNSSANPLNNGAMLSLNGVLVTDLVIPNTVTQIKNCTFSGCTSLTSVTIPSSVTTIGRYAFYHCTSLTSVEIPSSVTSIGYDAFSGCTSLTSVNYLGTIEQWCNISFSSYANPLNNGAKLYLNGVLVTDLVIPNTVTQINNYTFWGCTSLTSVTIPDSVTTIGQYVFYNCTSLTSIQIPSSVTSIGYDTFSGCTSLTSVNYLGTIEQWCNISFNSSTANPLYYGAKLYLNGVLVTDLIIPNTVTQIKNYTFRGCTSLTSVEIPSSVTTIKSNAFYGCTSLTSVTIPSSVTSIESNAFYGCTSLTSVNYLGTIEQWCNISFSSSSTANPLNNGAKLYLNGTLVTDLIIPNTVTQINNYTFWGCTSLTSVMIPNSVTSIGSSAFNRCTSLTSVNYLGTIEQWCNITFDNDYANPLNNGAKLYLNGVLVTDLVIPNTVTEIKAYAFLGCTSLTSVEIPSSVTTIKSNAFYGCTSLTSVNYLGTIEQWCNITFDNDYANPLSNGAKLYLNGVLVTDLIIPNTVTEIKACAFSGCTSLTSVEIPSSVTTIKSNAFHGCTSLTSVEIPSSVTTIKSNAFYGCTSLTSVEIPSSVTTIESYAFYGCTSLTSVNYLGTIEQWCNISFSSSSTANPLNNGAKLYLNGALVTDLLIPNTVTSIGDYAFWGCTSLESITIPNSVTSIGYYAFYGCTSLTSVNYLGTIEQWCNISFDGSYANPLYYAKKLYLNGVLVTDLVIPSSVTTIGWYAFDGCTSLTSVEIPSSVTSIGGYAFRGCTSLASVTIGTGVSEIGSSAFFGCDAIKEVHISDVSSWSKINFTNNYSNPLYYNDMISGDTSNVAPFGNPYHSSKWNADSDSSTIIDGNYNSSYEFWRPSSSGRDETIDDTLQYCGIEFENKQAVQKIVLYIFSIDFHTKFTVKALVDGEWIIIGEAYNTDAIVIESLKVNYSNGKIGLIEINLESELITDNIRVECTEYGAYAPGATEHDWWMVPVIQEVEIFGDTQGMADTNERNLYLNGEEISGDIILEDGITSLSTHFYGCEKITSIVIPNSVTVVTTSAFRGCASLAIYCEATEQPSDWWYNWNASNRPVVWGHTHSYTDGSCECGATEN